MAKLSTRQKNNIQAKWDTGQYTKTAIAKQYKVTEKVVREIVGKKTPTNTHIVEAQTLIENLKNSEKSPNEIQAINQAVQIRLREKYADDNKRVRIYDLSDKVLDKVEELLGKGTKQIVAKVKQYDGKASSESLDVVNVELDTSDYKNIQDTIDKVSITNNTNMRHAPKGDINLTQQIANNIEEKKKNLSDYYEDIKVIENA